MTSSMSGNGHEVDVVSDATESDSDDELFNRISDRTRLLQDASVHQSMSCDGRLRPDNMDSEIERQLQSEPQLQRKKSVVRRMMVLCVTTMLLLIALPLSTPSLVLLNINDDWLKIISLGCLYGCLFVSFIFSPFVIRKIGEKWTTIAGGFGVALCVSSRFHSSLSFVVPGFVAAGLLLGPCLTVLWSRVVIITNEHVHIVGAMPGQTLLLFNGIFQLWALGAGWVTQLLAMVALDFSWSHDPYPINNTDVLCGVHYCWHDFVRSPSFSIVSDESVPVMGHRMQALLGCLMACSVTAMLFALFGFDRLKVDDDEQSCCGVFGEVLLLLKKPEVCLLVPVLVLSGTRQHISYQYLVQAFSTCSLQSRLGSFSLLSALLASSFSAPLLGLLFGVAGRFLIAVPLLLLEAVMLLLTLMWPVDEWPVTAFFVILCLMGIIDSAWQVLCPALLAQLVPLQINASIAAFRACQVLGFLSVYAVQALSVCTQHLLAVVVILLAISAVCLVVMEIQVRLREQDMKSNPDEHKIIMPVLNDTTWLPHINPMRVRKERTSALLHRGPEDQKVRM